MIALSPGVQLVALGASALLLHRALGSRGVAPTSAGAVVMAIGIFIAAALQQMPILAPLITKPLSIALLIIWASIAVSYAVSALRGMLYVHSRPVIARFAIGTWVAATAVLARDVLWEIQEWRLLAIPLAILAFALWLWFLGLAARALPRIASMSSQTIVPGVVLLATVSTQSIALIAVDLLPSGSIQFWAMAGLIGAGVIFYAIGFALILRSHLRVAGWTLSEDWDNTNCILHGAMSITGLALASYPVAPPILTWIVWYYVLAMLLVVESVEVLRLISRLRKHGMGQGVLTYHVSQWARNFTFGMFYAFTLQLLKTGGATDPIEWGSEIGSVILAYGSWIVLLFLLIEVALYCKSHLHEERIPATNA
ncbi:hypothetical protein [Microvirga massiliensis]|uniref:hypothetical protein n=1 Tax=Microvirga massiliensis TaxID=1033741 RepID=UPI00062B9C14|nr:hypothetical protein [Microvirga massiliensis]